ncbi:ribonuclease P protein component domain protein [Neisseria elongata subsp. glycolytica ATCC 29315]|nr:ribonuclease P protein component domain protein [Neisseria elongata subsp. glycolytica ATCC 29315]
MKRVLRDWFRRHKAQLPPRDFVIRVRRPFGRDGADEIRAQLQRLLLQKS